ncbi:hypothetical protein [Caulobacter sp.]|uniref:hypothetical protein n=1 Tax=Caulobacter sp. TaxID=78 RepID=UPI001B2163C7|nr:hypothetical protein [Caulobacter sp.]MBO9544472.1 hypothetical protein [Caulobacter sp.]
MPRNPLWTADDAQITLANTSFKFPDGQLRWGYSTTTSYEYETSLSGSFTAGETIDFILVDLKVGSTYNFLATGDYQVSLAIYDMDGYLLQFTDGDDIGIPDRYPQDSILQFKPDYTGTYKIDIYYANLKTTGDYIIVGSEDVFGDFKNTRVVDSKALTAINHVMLLNLDSTKGSAYISDVLEKVRSGTWTDAQATKYIIDSADATTTVANLSYQFFTGKTPLNSGMQYLVSPTGGNSNNLNSAYYQNFNIENRYINFAVNLGINGEGKTKFAADYGSLTLAEATKKAYATIFGAAPTDAKVSVLLSGGRDLYFESYGHDGLSGLGTKAAMVGWLLAEAAKSDIGIYARASNDHLMASTTSLQNSVDLVGVYGKADYIYGGA